MTKKLWVFIGLLALLTSAYAASSGNTHTVKYEVKHMSTGDYVDVDVDDKPKELKNANVFMEGVANEEKKKP